MLSKTPPVEIHDNLRMLGCREYPFYLVKGDDDGLLIEGSVGGAAALLVEQLDELGIARDYPTQIVVLHAHPDHVMAVPALRKAMPRLRVVASEAAAKTLSVEKAVGFFRKVDQQLTDSLLKLGSIQERHRPQPLDEMRVPVDRTVGEGDAVAVGGVSLDVLSTPGHSECSLSLHDPKRGWLFISDATGYHLPEDGYFWPNYFIGYATYLGSIERLAALGATTLCLGHLAVFQGVEEIQGYFDRAVAATQQYHERIVNAARAGKDIAGISEELGREVYERNQMMPLEFLQKNCSLLVKMSLKHEGMEA